MRYRVESCRWRVVRRLCGWLVGQSISPESAASPRAFWSFKTFVNSTSFKLQSRTKWHNRSLNESSKVKRRFFHDAICMSNLTIELQNQYSNYKNTLQQIAKKIGDVEQEAEEHKFVPIFSFPDSSFKSGFPSYRKPQTSPPDPFTHRFPTDLFSKR